MFQGWYYSISKTCLGEKNAEPLAGCWFKLKKHTRTLAMIRVIDGLKLLYTMYKEIP